MPLVNHEEKGNCFHCEKSGRCRSNTQYGQQFNLVGVSELFSGFKHWYDVANTKLKSFVRGPIRIL